MNIDILASPHMPGDVEITLQPVAKESLVSQQLAASQVCDCIGCCACSLHRTLSYTCLCT